MTESIPSINASLRDGLRVEHPAPAGARERVRARLAESIPGMLAATAAGGGAPRAPEAGGATALAGRLGILGAYVLGGVTGAALLALLQGQRLPHVVYVDRAPPPAPPSVAVESPAPPEPANRPVIVQPVATNATLSPPTPRLAPAGAGDPPAASRSLATSRTTEGASAASRTSRFAEERMLLDEARAALVQGDTARSLARLDLHRARFADGLLGEERDAMQVEALVRAGRYEEARARAAAFRDRAPGSLFSSTVESAIGSIP